MENSVHVVTITPFYPSANNAVAGCFVADSVKALTTFGIESTVLAVEPFYRSKSKANAEYPADWLRYFAVPGGVGLSSAGAFLFARLLSKLRKLHRQKRVDVIHAHAPLPVGHAASLLSKELGIPFVVSVHGLDAYSANQVKGKAGEWCRRVTQHVFLQANCVICVSEHVREQVLNGVGHNCQTSVVYNGVDPERFSPSTGDKSSTILSVGNLIPTKGHEVLIRALGILRSQGCQISCEIIGEGPELERLKSIAAELGVGSQIHFRGRQNRLEVAEAMRKCMLFVLPSRYEALGCVYLEAMSSATPVIACRGQGMDEVIESGRNGWLVGGDDPAELAQAITTLLSSEGLLNQLRLASRRTILKSLTLHHQAQRLNEVYRSCI